MRIQLHHPLHDVMQLVRMIEVRLNFRHMVSGSYVDIGENAPDILLGDLQALFVHIELLFFEYFRS